MFGWLRRKPAPEPEPERLSRSMDLGNDPLNHNGDGVIRPGDPGWALFQEVIKNGGDGGVIANRNNDGTWDVERFSD